jgi:hypothetical protein
VSFWRVGLHHRTFSDMMRTNGAKKFPAGTKRPNEGRSETARVLFLALFLVGKAVTAVDTWPMHMSHMMHFCGISRELIANMRFDISS